MSSSLKHIFISCRGDIKAVIGKTLSCDDFYEGQARLDGASCDYTEQRKMEFLKKVHEKGMRFVYILKNWRCSKYRDGGIAIQCILWPPWNQSSDALHSTLE